MLDSSTKTHTELPKFMICCCKCSIAFPSPGRVQALPLTVTVLGRQKIVTVAEVILYPTIILGPKNCHYSYSVSL